ncbi:MAG: alanine racemase [Capsulimonadaceae bacterium]|nr:alanine racemase [Capsulimonadaceae bacterium]
MLPLSEKATTRAWAEIDSGALAANLHSLPVIPSGVMAVVKADAYGHGINLVAPVLVSEGVTHWGVATVEEGRHLRHLLARTPFNPGGHAIYVMPAVLPIEAPALIEHSLTPYCTDFELARALSNTAEEIGTRASVHIEVDTGIGRAGVRPADLSAFVDAVQRLPGVSITGICTHFTAADALEGPEDAVAQHALFESALASLDPALVSRVTVHAANSPATLRLAGVTHSLIRPGLLLYGIAPSAPLGTGEEKPFPYRPVFSLYARALLVRRLPAGSDISYSRTYRLERDATVVTIGIGYGDGFPRRLSSRGWALLPDGTRVPMRGRVCMDQICLELPEGASVKTGDPITLIGRAGAGEISVVEIADEIDTTPHEVTTCLTARVPRLLV